MPSTAPQKCLSSQFTGQDSKQLADEATVLANYEVGQRLGEGAYGSVYEVKYIPSGQRFAMKVLQKDDLLALSQTADSPAQSISDYEALERHIVKEATMMQSLEHPNLVKFYKFLNSKVAYYFIMDLAEGGELFDLVISEKYFSERDARYYFQQLMSAIDYCHRNGIAHKDLKAENLLLGRDDRLVVCDFGFSTKCVEDLIERQEQDLDSSTGPQDCTLQGAGTLHYMSPEAVTASSQNLFEYLGGFNGENSFFTESGTGDLLHNESPSSSGFTHPANASVGMNRSMSENWESGAEISVAKKKEKGGFFHNLIIKKKEPAKSSAGATPKGDGRPEQAKHQDPVVRSGVTTPLSTLESTSHFHQRTSTAPAVKIDPFQQDLWSAAVILFFMVTGRLPFSGRDDEETLHLIEEARVRFTPEEERRLSTNVKDLIHRMMRRDPEARLSRADVISHKWFKEGLNKQKVFPHLFEEADTPTPRAPNFLNFKERKSEAVTADEEAYLHSAFDAINTDELGGISRDQIRDALTTLSNEATKSDDVSEMMKLLTGDEKSEKVTFEEFRRAWVSRDLAHTDLTQKKHFQLEEIVKLHPKHLEPPTVRQLRTAFDSVDSSHTGVITIKQWKEFFERLNVKVETKDLVSLMQAFKSGTCGGGSSCGTPTESDYLSFDFFVSGIQEALLRHPMGRKLALATNLNALFNSYNVKDCLWHGFLVSCRPEKVLKLLQKESRLQLLHSSEMKASKSKTYTFRYTPEGEDMGSTRIDPASPFLHAHQNRGASDFEQRRSSMRATIVGGGGHSFRTFRTITLPKILMEKTADTTKGKEKLPAGDIALANSHAPLVGSSGTTVSGEIPPFSGCEVDVTLTPVGTDYVLVRFRRIYGGTFSFHESVNFISDLLIPEREKAMEDTMPRGESELM